jgi:hypothetical protein
MFRRYTRTWTSATAAAPANLLLAASAKFIYKRCCCVETTAGE